MTSPVLDVGVKGKIRKTISAADYFAQHNW